MRNDLIPRDVPSPENLADLLDTIRCQGIDVVEVQSKLPSSLEKEHNKGPNEEANTSQDVELDLRRDALQQTDDPVPIYLREMSAEPLLTREGEVEIAKRI